MLSGRRERGPQRLVVRERLRYPPRVEVGLRRAARERRPPARRRVVVPRRKCDIEEEPRRLRRRERRPVEERRLHVRLPLGGADVHEPRRVGVRDAGARRNRRRGVLIEVLAGHVVCGDPRRERVGVFLAERVRPGDVAHRVRLVRAVQVVGRVVGEVQEVRVQRAEGINLRLKQLLRPHVVRDDPLHHRARVRGIPGCSIRNELIVPGEHVAA